MAAPPKKKRYRRKHAKPGQLRVDFGLPEYESFPDVVYAWGGSGASKRDSMIVAHFFEGVKVDGRTLIQELEARGYDLSTLRFSIKHKSINEPER